METLQLLSAISHHGKKLKGYKTVSEPVLHSSEGVLS